MILIATPGFTLGSPTVQTLKLTPGLKVHYSVAVAETSFDAAGKATGAPERIFPIGIEVADSKHLRVTYEAVIVRGRSLGRSRVSIQTVNGGGCASSGSPAPFFVVLPPSGFKTGQSWSAPFFGGAPVPAGLSANYRAGSNSNGFVPVTFNVKGIGASQVSGSGTLFLRQADGFLDHGSIVITLAFMRPDQKNPKQLVVNSKTILKYKITPK